MKELYLITWLAEMAGIQHSGYYKWVKNGGAVKPREKRKIIKTTDLPIHQEHKEYGYPRMKIALQERGFFVNPKKMY
ncbi:hypothetical protein [Bacillus massiliglaciei]|uniref:hypothetical protein n=1 Tax=Bacillus massiliglaciei TaxID=1816693 RepID=UPI000AEF1907|nr:hypothetical protein [Bacillus massiliglaciei]